jgi:hypothetical protein
MQSGTFLLGSSTRTIACCQTQWAIRVATCLATWHYDKSETTALVEYCRSCNFFAAPRSEEGEMALYMEKKGCKKGKQM